jgi:hypothetical protein
MLIIFEQEIFILFSIFIFNKKTMNVISVMYFAPSFWLLGFFIAAQFGENEFVSS